MSPFQNDDDLIFTEADYRDCAHRAAFEGFMCGMDAAMAVLEDSLEKHEVVEQKIILGDMRRELQDSAQMMMNQYGIKPRDEEAD